MAKTSAPPPQWLATVRAGAWFASLADELAAALLSEALPLQLSAGRRLFARGDVADGLYCVVEGSIRINAVDENGHEALLALLGPPQWFGEIALFDGEPRTHDAWADGATCVLHLPQRGLLALLAERPGYWREFGRLLTQKLRQTFEAVEEIALLPPTPRLARRLAAMASSDCGTSPDRSRRVLDVSQEQLGLMLSLSRQTVNQSLRILEASGALRRHRGSIEIVDLERLLRVGA